MFDSKSQVPCVGMSIGVERLFAVMEMKLKADNQQLRSTSTQVFVISAQENLIKEKLKLCNSLWKAGIKVFFIEDFQNKIDEADRSIYYISILFN
jgi:histidyl-tRNA synthetase